ncbi:MAG: heme/hemin ABC transporter substrate-binding protein, partial [Sphingobacterium sp.]
MKRYTLLLVLITLLITNVCYGQKNERIISLNGAITEVLDAVGVGNRIVAVDVTSDYPAYIKEIPKVSKNRSVTAESISAFKPDLVLGLQGEVSQELQRQLERLKIPVILIKQEFSVRGLDKFIKAVAASVGEVNTGDKMAAKVQAQLIPLTTGDKKSSEKIMFIYARGAGQMSVSGGDTAVDAVIRLSGFSNALTGFSGFKTYNTEALVAANPDAILLFDFGMSSLGGADGILKMPGVKLTNAGKSNKIISLDAGLLNNFSVRLP